jgi:hypothetical protein
MNRISEISTAVSATRLIGNRNYIVTSATILISKCRKNKKGGRKGEIGIMGIGKLRTLIKMRRRGTALDI